VALLDGETLPLTFAGIQAGNHTRGHRFHNPTPTAVTGLEDWLETMAASHVMPNRQARTETIQAQVNALAQSAGGVIQEDDALLEEVAGLVEWPVPLLGQFESRFLEVPAQVLVTAMKVHQRYFPIFTQEGTLTNHFVLVSGTVVNDPAVVVDGNEKVIRPRLADAEFFFDQDKKTSLDTFVSRLEQRTFLKGLGTMRDKATRLARLSKSFARHTAPGSEVNAERAGLLAKGDLSSAMVGEFAKLQGHMGRDYARLAGEAPDVAEAIYEHYLPRFATDTLPETALGATTALADRWDSIVGCFVLGLEPSGSADPYALRRQALGILRISIARPEGPTLTEGFQLTTESYEDGLCSDWDDARDRVMTFMRNRLKHMLTEAHPTDLVEAVLASGFDNVGDTLGRLKALNALKQTSDWDDLAIAVKRVVRIVADQPTSDLDTATLDTGAEQGLYDAYSGALGRIDTALEQRDYETALSLMADLRPPIDRFFDDVMVMSDDPAERQRRLALLALIATVFHRMADFSRVST